MSNGGSVDPGAQIGNRPGLREVLRTKGFFRVAFGVLVLLYSAAIYAPLIASDRPLVFEGLDIRGFESAGKSLRSVASGLGRRLAQTDADYRQELSAAGTLDKPGVPHSLEGAIAEEFAALRTRLARIRGPLPDPGQASGVHDRLLAFESLVDGGEQAYREGRREDALATIGRAKEAASRLRSDLRCLDVERPGEGGIALVGKRTYPLLDALGPFDVFLFVLWPCVLLWRLWTSRISNPWLACAALILVPASAAALHGATWGAGENMHVSSPHKAGLADGGMLALAPGRSVLEAAGAPGTVLWTPLPYGVAESHREEGFRPPTWTAAAETDADGRRVGATSATAGGPVEAQTPVVVRAGEPQRNAWNRHVLGTDNQGRDLLARLIWGARTSLTVGLLSALLLTILGVLAGALAGYFGGWVDVVILRTIEVLQSIPAFFLILMAMAFLPPESVKPIFAVVMVIAFVRWTGTARLVRAEFLKLREAEYVLAARALGYSHGRIVFRHILPNAMAPVLVSAAFAVATGILTESAVSFLGFGIQPPEASWGALINASRSASHWWIQLFPGLLIFVTVTCYNLVGDAVRDALDPRLTDAVHLPH